MKVPATIGAIGNIRRSTALADLASPGRLLRPARLYAVVVGEDGAAGPRHFLADLPQGSAVFALAAAGVSFLLVEHRNSAGSLLAAGPIDAAAIDAWHAALLSSPELTHADTAAMPMVAPESRVLPAQSMVTAREIVWLQAATPILRYAATAT